MENYVADSIQEQAAPVPQLWPWDGKGRMSRETAMIRSDLMLGRLVRNHPEKIRQPDDITTEPANVPILDSGPQTNVVVLPVDHDQLLPERPPMNMIVEEVAAFYRLTLVEICSDRRADAVVWPRHVAMWLCRKLTTNSLPAIGRKLGGRDHSTCLNACRRVEKRLTKDDRFADEIQVLKLRLAQRVMKKAA